MSVEILTGMIEMMNRRAVVEARVKVVRENGEAEAVHVVAAERGTAHGVNIPVDTETTITRTEIGVQH